MQVASLANSKRLYELSGWELSTNGLAPADSQWYFTYPDGSSAVWMHPRPDHEQEAIEKIPAYDAGYLLRKLQKKGASLFLEYGDLNYPSREQSWGISWCGDNGPQADTPEDCLALLAIKLFETGVLK